MKPYCSIEVRSRRRRLWQEDKDITAVKLQHRLNSCLLEIIDSYTFFYRKNEFNLEKPENTFTKNDAADIRLQGASPM